MINRRNILFIILSLGVVGCLTFTCLTYLNTPKISFVRSAVIVENYFGMKDAKKAFELKANEWKKNLDTLLNRYNQASSYLNVNRNRLSQKEIKGMEEDISRKGENYKKYSEEIDKIAKEENDKLTQGAFNQINSYIEKYSKEHHIDIVIGVTLSGNVLYGADKIDITDKVLEGLNKSYR